MILTQDELPEDFRYPSEFQILIDQGLLDFDPWVIIIGERLRTRYAGLKARYPKRKLVPFAKREDNDDLACFESARGVVVIHDFASSGFEGGQTPMSFWDWFRMIVEDMIDHNS